MSYALPHPQPDHRPGGVSEAVDEDVIRAVVDGFYSAARQDPLLGPVFGAHVANWEPHLETMYAFWASVLRGKRGYTGNPFKKHLAVPELSADHFERWLELFSETLSLHCSPDDAAAWEVMARRMGFAMSSRLGFGQHIELLP